MFWRRISIARRLSLGFGLVIVLLAVVAGTQPRAAERIQPERRGVLIRARAEAHHSGVFDGRQPCCRAPG